MFKAMIDGELTHTDNGVELRFTRRLAPAPERVFAAPSEPAELSAWFPFTIEGGRAVGDRLRFVNSKAEVEGELLAYEPPRLIEYGWGEGETLRFEIAPDGDGSVLTFVNLIT